MLEARFAITCHPSRDFIEMSVSEFFTVADVGRLMEEQRRVYRQLRCAPNQHVTLCDASGMKIQTQDVVGAFGAMARNPAMQSRRLAIIVGSSLARMQTQRIADQDNIALFRDRATAMAWLFPDA